MEGGKPESPEKNPRSKDENQQQTQPTYGAGSGNRTRATLVGGERSHHCAIPAPSSMSSKKYDWLWEVLRRRLAGSKLRVELEQVTCCKKLPKFALTSPIVYLSKRVKSSISLRYSNGNNSSCFNLSLYVTSLGPEHGSLWHTVLQWVCSKTID